MAADSAVMLIDVAKGVEAPNKETICRIKRTRYSLFLHLKQN